MRAAALFLIFIGVGLSTVQAEDGSLKIRAISVKTVTTSVEGLSSIGFAAISEAWERNEVDLAGERPLEVDSIVKAKEVIREMHAGAGQAVRVEHSVNQIPRRGVEVAFQVIELCECR